MTKAFAFVLDGEGKKLSPTPKDKAWYLIRHKKATIVSLIPFTIKLTKTIPLEDVDSSKIKLGIDDGSKFTGVSLIQEGKRKVKPLFKGTVEHRQDVKHLMDVRRGYRKYHRYHKKYRKQRWGNRASASREGRIAPSIKQKKDATLRTTRYLNKLIRIDEIILEDVLIDIRALTEGKKLYRWQYQKSNRLDENLRLATLIRDNYSCQECGKTNCVLEVHHITPRRLKGADTLSNLITLCSKCHNKSKRKSLA
jgi:RRXRR protein/HNH endonuclease